MATENKDVLCVGEALIDVIDHQGEVSEHVGGSVLNVATGLARLDVPTSLRSWWSNSDDHGRQISEHVEWAGIKVVNGTFGAEHTPVALAQLDENHNADYKFEITWQVEDFELSSFRHLHTGSLATAIEPGASKVLGLMEKMRQFGTVSYDPNVRPRVLGSPKRAVHLVESFVQRCDIVKASADDIDWLYAEQPVADVVGHWLDLGAQLVVITGGDSGAAASAKLMPEPISISSAHVDVVDTVGAGDSFMAGLLAAFWDAKVLGSRGKIAQVTGEQLVQSLNFAAAAAGQTVTRAGAYAPTRDDLN